MTLTDTSTFQITTIDPAELDQVRRSDRDTSGHPVEHLVAKGGEPLRCCLRVAREGEEILLFGYEPVIPASPYPPAWRGRPQVLRAYDSRGWIHAAMTHDGSDPERAIAELLSDPEVVQIHSRNIAYGCYMFTVTRAGVTP